MHDCLRGVMPITLLGLRHFCALPGKPQDDDSSDSHMSSPWGTDVSGSDNDEAPSSSLRPKPSPGAADTMRSASLPVSATRGLIRPRINPVPASAASGQSPRGAAAPADAGTVWEGANAPSTATAAVARQHSASSARAAEDLIIYLALALEMAVPEQPNMLAREYREAMHCAGSSLLSELQGTSDLLGTLTGSKYGRTWVAGSGWLRSMMMPRTRSADVSAKPGRNTPHGPA